MMKKEKKEIGGNRAIERREMVGEERGRTEEKDVATVEINEDTNSTSCDEVNGGRKVPKK